MTLVRWIGGLSVLIVGILVVSYMQRKFDEGDLRKAIDVVEAKIPGIHGCYAEIFSRFRGMVLVRCERDNQSQRAVEGEAPFPPLPRRGGGGDASPYYDEWVIDLVHATIGGNDHGK